jgi:hypothetical protein
MQAIDTPVEPPAATASSIAQLTIIEKSRIPGRPLHPLLTQEATRALSGNGQKVATGIPLAVTVPGVILLVAAADRRRY